MWRLQYRNIQSIGAWTMGLSLGWSLQSRGMPLPTYLGFLSVDGRAAWDQEHASLVRWLGLIWSQIVPS